MIIYTVAFLAMVAGAMAQKHPVGKMRRMAEFNVRTRIIGVRVTVCMLPIDTSVCLLHLNSKDVINRESQKAGKGIFFRSSFYPHRLGN